MTSKSFRRSRRRQSQRQQQRKSRRGGYGALANAASASVLPVGLTLLQQHYKKKKDRNSFKTMRKFGKYMTPKN
jgi:hypothetical protein